MHYLDRKNKILLSLFLIFLFIPSLSYAVIQKAQMKVFAVTSAGGAIAADLIIELKPGHGKCYFALTSLIGTTTQAAGKTAVNVAKNYASNAANYDYFFDINAPAALVEGPSAGAAMTLLIISMLKDKPLPEHVAITGTITSDGSVGKVGGVFEKAKAAAKAGIKLFMIPKGEAKQIVKEDSKVETVYLPNYALTHWGLKVVEVSTIDDVLKYAYMNLEEIDINAIKEGAEEIYTPEAIAERPALEPLRKLTQKYISNAKELIAGAKTSLGGSLLEDQALIDVLLQTLNDADSVVKEAELLLQRNYLYSAANSAFVAAVSARMVKDIAENPSLLNIDSAVYEMKLSSLQSNLEKLRKKYEQYVPLDKIEWYIGGMQRLSYALNVIKKLTATETLTVNIEVPYETTTKYSVALQNIQDYEFALGWYNVAKDFYEVFSESKQKVDYAYISEQKPFLNEINRLIIDAENGMAAIPKEDYEDVLRRINAAKLAKQNGWYFSAIVDASSAVGLINASIQSKKLSDGSVEEFLNKVKEKINALDQNLSDNNKYIWARIYLDHAIYFLKSAEHYYDEDSILTAKGKLDNALSLAYMAEAVYEATNSVYSYLSKEEIPSAINQEQKQTQETEKEQAKETPGIIWVMLGAIMGIVFASGMLIIAIYYLKKTQFIMPAKQDLEKQLELAYATNRISASEYASLKKKIQKEKAAQEKQQKEKAKVVLEIDRINAELHAQSHLLRDLKHRHAQHLISDADYHIQLKRINDKIASLQKRLKIAREKLKKLSKKKSKLDLF